MVRLPKEHVITNDRGERIGTVIESPDYEGEVAKGIAGFGMNIFWLLLAGIFILTWHFLVAWAQHLRANPKVVLPVSIAVIAVLVYGANLVLQDRTPPTEIAVAGSGIDLSDGSSVFYTPTDAEILGVYENPLNPTTVQTPATPTECFQVTGTSVTDDEGNIWWPVVDPLNYDRTVPDHNREGYILESNLSIPNTDNRRCGNLHLAD